MFGLFGALFVLTQYLQFGLGYSALQAGIRVLPAAGAIAIVAPFSTVLVRAIGTKLTVAAGLLVIAGGLWQISTASAATTYAGILPGMILLGVGAGLTIPSATESVMGSLPGGHTGVGSATNGAFLQVGGALGVAVIGSLLNTRYQDTMTGALASLPRSARVHQAILGSLGGALGVADTRRRRPRRRTRSPGPLRLRQRDGPGPGHRGVRGRGRVPHRPARAALPGRRPARTIAPPDPIRACRATPLGDPAPGPRAGRERLRLRQRVIPGLFPAGGKAPVVPDQEERGSLPAYIPGGGSERIEVNLAKEVLVLYLGNQVSLISHVSSGGGYYYCSPGGGCGDAVTPTGDYTTTAFMPGWVTVPLGEMYNPVFFIGTAYAIHGDTDVPLQPVSHGCVRIPMDIAAFFHMLVRTPGTPVYIRG